MKGYQGVGVEGLGVFFAELFYCVDHFFNVWVCMWRLFWVVEMIISFIVYNIDKTIINIKTYPL